MALGGEHHVVAVRLGRLERALDAHRLPLVPIGDQGIVGMIIAGVEGEQLRLGLTSEIGTVEFG